jgi:GrpB-like predicted nucleotidyltransferase (UPF0157 family)
VPPANIEILDYDPGWPVAAAAAIAELRRALPGLFTELEHIGSTSVPGLSARPVIDLMGAVPALAAATDREAALLALGHWRLDTGMPGRLFHPRDRDGRRAYQLHVVPAETWATRNERLLRDHLREHPADARRYDLAKRELAGSAGDPAEHTRAKTAVTQVLTDRARAARGLPSVSVWEE